MNREAIWSAALAYDKYFKTGCYSIRYPRPNTRSLSLILRYAKRARNILDFGCGHGRYTLPIAEQSRAEIVACDISQEALQGLQSRLLSSAYSRRVKVVKGSYDVIGQYGPFDLVICMFGTLSHLLPKAQRIAALNAFQRSLRKQASSRVVLSVPNSFRRFGAEQEASLRDNNIHKFNSCNTEEGDIRYIRRLGNEGVEMSYHLYSTSTLKNELALAGLDTLSIVPESILTESLVTRYHILGKLDGFCSCISPAFLGYGLLAVAGPSVCPGGK